MATTTAPDRGALSGPLAGVSFIAGIGGLASGVTAFRAVSVANALCPSANESLKYFKICSFVRISSGPFVVPASVTPAGGVCPRMAL